MSTNVGKVLSGRGDHHSKNYKPRLPAPVDWMIDARRGALTLQLTSRRGNPLQAEFADFAGALRLTPTGSAGSLDVRIKVGSLRLPGLKTPDHRSAAAALLDWRCGGLALAGGDVLTTDSEITHRGLTAGAIVRGGTSALSEAVVTICLVATFDARKLEWPGLVRGMGGPHVRLKLDGRPVPDVL